MLLRSISRFVHGVVTIEISGSIPEKLINLCIAHDIFSWNVNKRAERFYVTMYLHDFFCIRPLVYKSQCHVRVVAYRGLPFLWKRLRKRKVLWLGIVLFFGLLNYLSAYVWFISVSGTQFTSTERVLAVARAYGLERGTLKSQLHVKVLEDHLRREIPEIAWVGVSLQGTHVAVEIVEKAIAIEEDRTPANIIAAKDGIIVETIALAGQPLVKEGATVKHGDLLIRGVAYTPIEAGVIAKDQEQQEQLQPIRAKGIVRARVWYESYGEALMEETTWERTGNYVSTVSCRLNNSWEMMLTRPVVNPFAHFEVESIDKTFLSWRNTEPLVECTINTYRELRPQLIVRGQEAARELARERALALVKQQIPEPAQILANDIVVLPTNEPNMLRVKIQVETIEDIAVHSNIQ